MEQKKERRNERIQPNRPCLRWQDSDNGQKNNPESSRPRLRRSDGDDDPRDSIPKSGGMCDGRPPEAKHYPQHQEPSLADGG